MSEFTPFQHIGLKLWELQQLTINLRERIVVDDRDLPAWVLTSDKEMLPEENTLEYEQHCLDITLRDMLGGEENRDRRLAADLYGLFQYQEGQDPRSTLKGCGLIGASRETLNLATTINVVKSELSKLYKPLSKLERAHLREPDSLSHIADAVEDLDGKHFITHGSPFHFLQIERHITMIDKLILHAGFSLGAINRSINPITYEDAKEALKKYGEEQEHIKLQLDKLKSYKGSRTAELMRQIKQNILTNTANLKLGTEDNYERTSQKFSMPILFLAKKDTHLPSIKVHFPRKKSALITNSQARSHRSDKRIDETPFLPSIKVHLIEEEKK